MLLGSIDDGGGGDDHDDDLNGDNIDGVKNQINRGSLAVGQLATLCILSHT